jgi:hypothetical protein
MRSALELKIMENPYRVPISNLTELQIQESVREIALYWEKRRIVFNLALLFVGLAGSAVSGLFSLLHPFIIIIDIILYAIFANIFYTVGPYSNIAAVLIFGAKNRVWWPVFYIGLVFSMFLTGMLGLASIYILTPF